LREKVEYVPEDPSTLISGKLAIVVCPLRRQVVNSKGFRIFSCSLLLVSALTLACAAEAGTIKSGQFVTGTQGDWGVGGGAAALLAANYNTVYASTNGVLIVGVENTTGQFSMYFTSAGAVQSYLPATGIAGQLTATLVNPALTPAGIFGGDVVALMLNVDFNNAGLLGSTSTIPFGSLVLTNLPAFDGALNGLTVEQFLAVANMCLGGGACPDGLSNVAAITDDLNDSFPGGTVSTFADTNLALPVSVTPEPSSLLLFGSSLLALVPFSRKLFGR
jgi:hypothetical protein